MSFDSLLREYAVLHGKKRAVYRRVPVVRDGSRTVRIVHEHVVDEQRILIGFGHNVLFWRERPEDLL